jgi:hypothetical protein
MTKRLKILSPADIIQYYEAPVFTSDEYDYYFKLDIHEEGILQEVGFVSSKAYFILLLGYFKAKQQLLAWCVRRRYLDQHKFLFGF